MKLELDNGNEFEMVESKYNIFYGPNKIGKTQISKALKKYFESLNENVLLFDENIVSNMIIQESFSENSFEIMPRIQEYNKYKTQMDSLKDKLEIKKNLKSICTIDTKKGFANFEIISKYIDENIFSYTEEIKNSIYTTEEISILFKKPKKGLLNFFEIIDNLISDNINIVPEDIKTMVNIDVYNIQKNILENPEKYKTCPVCYNDISGESLELIRKSIEMGSIQDTLKESILFYIDNQNENVKQIISSFLISDSYNESKIKIIKNVEDSILCLLKDLYDIKDIKLYNESKQNIESILKEIKDFKLEDNLETYNYIKSKFKQHSVYKNSDVDITIENGKLKILNSPVEFNNMSKSEQNFFKFLYFDTLVYQKKSTGMLHVIVDDPFDSYDDIFVHDSINIIVKLIKESIEMIDSFNIFSHSMYAIYLYDSIISNHYNNFNIFWLDKIRNSKNINVYSDKYKLLKKIEDNPCDYGLILKISDKLVDKYSLVAFSSMLRNEISMEQLLIKKNNDSNVCELRKNLNSISENISKSVNHIKSDMLVSDLLKDINTIFNFNLVDDVTNLNISSIFDDITPELDEISIKSISDKSTVSDVNTNDICYILIYKYLLGMKIRRNFELKAVKNSGETKYKNIGELIPYLKNNLLIDFYNTYNFVLNSFNHSSSRIVPPIFVYSMVTLQEIYIELEKIII